MHKHELADLFELAAKKREESYRVGTGIRPGYYRLSIEEAAKEAAKEMKVDDAWGQIAHLMLQVAWNDALDWAKVHGIPKCTCTFRASGVSLDNTGCVVHTKGHYKCDQCACDDYKPHKQPTEQVATLHMWSYGSGAQLMIDLRDYLKKKKGWWMEWRASVPAMLPPDGLIVYFRREDVEALMDKEYPHRQERNRKVWYFNDTYDREIAEMDDDMFVVANPQVLIDHYIPRS